MPSAKWCAPDKEGNRLTCYTIQQLKKIAREYNKNSSNKIKINNRTKEQLWNDIRNALANKCNNEICWIDQDFIKKTNDKELLTETFRPKMDSEWKNNNYTIWLNTDDINYVMKQYEKKYPDFIFIGSVPIDCGINNPLSCELTNFNINRAYDKGIRTIGIIYNTGDSYSSGIHWFAIFIDLRKKDKTFEYYDSYASNYLPEIKKLYQKLNKDMMKKNMSLIIDKNKVRKQYDNYNCGIYSINFIVERLKGKTLAQIDKMKLNTKQMQKLKKEWYRK